MIFVHSTRDMFVCSLRKTFGHLSDRAKKTMVNRMLIQEHYISTKVFVSRCGKETAASLQISGLHGNVPSTQLLAGPGGLTRLIFEMGS